MTLSKEQSEKIQILRGIAIIAVVFIHNTPGLYYQVFCRPFLNFSVALFLFLSGMLSDANNWKPKKRIIKIAIPYVIWTLVFAVIYNVHDIANILPQFFTFLVSGRAAAIMYYVFVYCEFVLLTPLIDRLAKSRYKLLGLFIMPLEVIIMRLIPLLLRFEYNAYIQLAMYLSCLGWFSFFYLGYLMGNHLLSDRILTGTSDGGNRVYDWIVSSKVLSVLLILSVLLQGLETYWYMCRLDEFGCGTQNKLSAIVTNMIFLVLCYRYIMGDCDRRLIIIREWNSKEGDSREGYFEDKACLWNKLITFCANLLKSFGDCSSGIFFSHLAIMHLLKLNSTYKQIDHYPINATLVCFIALGVVVVGKKILGKYSKYLGF